MIDDLFDFKKCLNDENIILSFSGPFSQDLLTEIGGILRKKLKLDDANTSLSMKVFSVFIEQAQNIIHYSAEIIPKQYSVTGEYMANGIIVIGYKMKKYYVKSGNLVEKDKVDKLKNKLELLKKMNKDELKKYYKEQRRKGSDEDSMGAGLGFIEIARKSSEPIDYEFVDYDANRSFFIFTSKI